MPGLHFQCEYFYVNSLTIIMPVAQMVSVCRDWVEVMCEVVCTQPALDAS